MTEWILADGIKINVAEQWAYNLRRAGYIVAADMVKRGIELRIQGCY